MDNNLRLPVSVMVQGRPNPVSLSKGNIKIEENDPLVNIKRSSFDELLPASTKWVKKYGGSDISIVAYNVHLLMKEKENGTDKAES